MKKISCLCMLSLLLLLTFTGCGDKEEYPNPNYNTEGYLSGLHYAEMVIEDYGPLYLVMDADAAPATVTNFVRLIDEGFFNGLTFHRVVEGYIIQGGDPKANGSGGSAYNLPGEFALNGFENTISHVRGTISMARGKSYDSASSQFFIVQEDDYASSLDGSYAAFGTVVSGMDYVDEICKYVPVVDSDGNVAYDDQPVISYAISLTEEEFKFLEQHNFVRPEESEDDTAFSIVMDMVEADHGKTVTETWTIHEDSRLYLLSANQDLKKVSLYDYDLVTAGYDAENPLASYEDLSSLDCIQIEIVVPEDIPANILLVEKENGSVVRYLICYDSFKGGVTLAPLDDPESN